jgi:hypothetical protein
MGAPNVIAWAVFNGKGVHSVHVSKAIAEIIACGRKGWTVRPLCEVAK